MAGSAFFELVYRLRARRPSASVPLALCERFPDLAVATRVCHLDEAGNVWRLLEVRGTPSSLAGAEEAFLGLDLPFILERSVLSRSPRVLVLFYKYRPLRRSEGFSNTVAAFRILGRDTIVTDETRHGAVTIRLRSRQRAKLARFYAAVGKGAGGTYAVELVRLGPVLEENRAVLSAAEEALLAAAHDAGYFDLPRRTDTRALAGRLGLPASTVSYRLRAMQAKLVRRYLGS